MVAEEQQEEDLRSIEAEIVDDDDELDADLEREFLLQQEAKCRQQGLGSSEDNLPSLTTPGEENWNGVQLLQFPGLTPGWKASLESEGCALDNLKRPVSRESLGAAGVSPQAVACLLSLFAVPASGRDFAEDEQLLVRNATEIGRTSGAEKHRSGSAVFQAPGLEDKEKWNWLRLGPPSTNSNNSVSCQKVVSNLFKRKLMSGSTSKVSTATRTSLERQYSTGSTSTVESPFPHEKKRGNRDGVPHEAPAHSPCPPRLMFSFPGWVVDMSKGDKHNLPVVSRHPEAIAEVDPSPERPSKRLREDSEHPGKGEASSGNVSDENLGDRSPVRDLPDDVLLQVMRKLNVKDLCSSVQTCRRWYAVGLQNNLWEHFVGDFNCVELNDSTPDVLPRWLCKKNLILSENVRNRFNVFRKGYDYLRVASHEWWNDGLKKSRHPSKGMYSLVRKLTAYDWSLLYEALGVVFTDRADRIAISLLKNLKPVGQFTGKGTASELTIGEKRDCQLADGILSSLPETPKIVSVAGTSSEFDVHWKPGSVKEVSEVEGVIGKELWEAVLKSWKRFKAWLQLISTHCPDLNSEVMLERARSFNRAATPFVYEKGLICFRSQVVLRYGLRSVLQAGFIFLTNQEARDSTSEHDLNLLRSSHHLLQELDVPDDFALPPKSHTQTKLRHTFRSALLTNSKLALHMNCKRNHT